MSFLARLYEYAISHGLERDAYLEEQEVEWLLCVKADLSVSLQKLQGPRKGRGFPYHLPIPLKRTSGLVPNFPADNPVYTLGMQFPDEKERADPDWHLKCHDAYIKQIARAAFECGDQDLRLIARALEKHQGTFDKLEGAKDVTSMDCICPATWQKDAFVPVSEKPLVLDWWRENYPKLQKMISGRGICMVTGKEANLARLHPLVSGVDGGKSTGVTLITFNSPSSESWGKKQGDNAQVSVDVAILASKALSRIMSRKSGKRRSVEISKGLHMSFITRKESQETAADFILSLLDPVEDDFSPESKGDGFAPRERRVWTSHQKLFNALAQGALPVSPETSVDLLVTQLRPSSARIEIVRYEEESFGTVADNLKAYFQHLEMYDPWTKSIRSNFTLKTVWPKERGPKKGPVSQGLMDALKIPDKDNSGLRPEMAGAFFLAAIEGKPLPLEVMKLALASAARSARAGRGIHTPIAALLKLCLNREYSRPECHLMDRWRKLDPNFKGVNPMLDTECKIPAYLLGRVLAAAERIQGIAIPSAEGFVVKRLYDGLMKSPGMLMPGVLRDINHHTAKIARSNPRLAGWCRKQIGQILEHLPADQEKAFPRTLDLPSQCLFSLGYQHQRNYYFTKKEDKEEPMAAAVVV